MKSKVYSSSSSNKFEEKCDGKWMWFWARYSSLKITSSFLWLEIFCMFKLFAVAQLDRMFRPFLCHWLKHLCVRFVPIDRFSLHFSRCCCSLNLPIDACRHPISLALVFIPIKFINANDSRSNGFASHRSAKIEMICYVRVVVVFSLLYQKLKMQMNWRAIRCVWPLTRLIFA